MTANRLWNPAGRQGLAFRALASVFVLSLFAQAHAGTQRRPAPRSAHPAAASGGSVYPQFRSSYGVIHWLPAQMPLKVFVSRGLSLDQVGLTQMGAPVTNTDNRDHWPDIVASVCSNEEQFRSLPTAEGFQPEHYDAALQGISFWKPFEKEGVLSFNFTNDPGEADIFVFWTNHFTDKLGMGLFRQDIRGYTAKRSFPLKPVLAAISQGKQIDFVPVVILLRTTEGNGVPMPVNKMRASAGHEFGHALGIEEHSTNSADLMSIYYGYGMLSRNDIATMRYLYHLQPDFVP